jgi:aromatic ring-opening dioxygenase LigB subunit
LGDLGFDNLSIQAIIKLLKINLKPMLVYAAITPHPPIIVPGIGQEKDLAQVAKTIKSLEMMNRDLKKIKPDTVIVISPHAQISYFSFLINQSSILDGSFSGFGLNKKFKFNNDRDLVREIKNQVKDKGLEIKSVKDELDHGSLVPLYYLTQELKVDLVVLSFSMLSLNHHFKYGGLISEVIEKSDKKIAVIASGDLSHKITDDAPAGYSPYGAEFDKKLIKLLKLGNSYRIVNMEEELIDEAGECGLRSIVIALGCLGKVEFKFEELSYEAPFGVGYLTGRFNL